jgi:hypothetical protein
VSAGVEHRPAVLDDDSVPVLFRWMLAEHGAVQAARRLVLNKDPSYGLWRLQTINKLDMSVEMWVLLPWYEPLFDPEVRDQAECKLCLLRVDVASELERLVRRLGEKPAARADPGDHLGTTRHAQPRTTCTAMNGPHRAVPLMTCGNG